RWKANQRNSRVQLVTAVCIIGQDARWPTAKMAVLLPPLLFDDRARVKKATSCRALDSGWDRAGPVVDRNVLSLALLGFPGSLGPVAGLPRGIPWPGRYLPQCQAQLRGFQ